jgi:hypothetical protein
MKVPTSFSLWMRNHLKDAFSGLITQDIDFIIIKPDNHFFFVEEKLFNNARTGPAQAIVYKLLSDILSNDPFFEGCHKITVNTNKTLFVNQYESRQVTEFINNPQKDYRNSFNQTWFEIIINFYLKYLWDCSGSPTVRKTEQEHTAVRKSNLEKILQDNQISFSSIDWIFVNYCSGNFILLFENHEIHESITRIINFFENNNSQPNKAVNPKSNAPYKFLGSYNISYKEDFSFFTINGHVVSKHEAIEALNLEKTSILKYKK